MRHFSDLLKMTVCMGLLVSLSACQFKKDDGNEQSPAAPKVNPEDVKTVIDQVNSQNKEADEAALLSSEVDVSFRDGRRNEYTMVIKIPKRIKNAEVTVDSSTDIHTISGVQSVEEPVFANTKYTIEIQTKSRGKIISQIKIGIESPKDLVVSNTRLTKDTDLAAHRIYLLDGAKIATYGFALNIHADQLISESGAIYSFPVGYSSRNEAELKNSTINIAARSIKGTLTLGLRGVNGVNGRSGTELEQFLGLHFNYRGDDGAPARSHMSAESCRRDIRTKEEVCRPGVPVCDSYPTDGQKGPAAPAARNGEDGTNGGDQGHLVLTTEDLSEANITINTHVGIKGRGGDPAERHQFPGGKPGPMDSLGACASKPASPGPAGDMGAAGKRGLDGIDGNEGTLVLPKHLPGFDRHVTVQKVR